MLITADWWVYKGFTVTGGLNGIYTENANHNVFDSLLIEQTGQTAIGLLGSAGSSYNTVTNLTIRDTGLHTTKRGEGIYVGSGSVPVPSNYNRIIGNILGPNITAEHIDVKRGSIGTLVQGNISDATGSMFVEYDIGGVYADNASTATQWLDNVITNVNKDAVGAVRMSGFFFYLATSPRASGNSVTAGTGMYLGFNVIGGTDIVISCDNTVIGGRFAPVACTP
jgi:hypothetical protein